MRLLLGLSCAVFVLGCSDDSKPHHLPDAPPPPDAIVDAATDGPVTLTITQGTTPRVGIRVLFQAADSSVVSDTTTGTDGKASAVMKQGGFVTTFDPFGIPQGAAFADIRTWAGVKPGDQLVLTQSDFATPTTVNVNIVLPIDNNATEYHVYSQCDTSIGATITAPGSGGQPMASVPFTGCGATVDLLVESVDANLQPVQQIFKPNVALVEGATIDLMNDTYTAIQDLTVTYMNVPAALSNVSTHLARRTTHGTLREADLGPNLLETGTTNTFTLKLATITNATAATVSTFVGPQFTQHVVTDWGPAGPYTLDATGLFLPDFDGAATLDVAAHAIKWTTSGGSVQPDLVDVTAGLNRDLGGGATQSWRWEIVAPGASQAVFPVLPDASPYNPMTGDFGFFDVRTAKVPGGYDAVRANAMSIDPRVITIGASGRAVFAFLVEPGFRKRPPEQWWVRGRTQTRR